MSNLMFGVLMLAIVLAVSWYARPPAADQKLCKALTWDVSHELTVMQQTPQEITAAAKPGPGVPQIDLEKPHGLTLAAQSGVTFVVNPEKSALEAGSQAGLVRFHVSKAGRYRVSISSRHWIDIVDGARPLMPRDFQGLSGCERPRKIVEYELPADHELILQLSRSTDAQVIVAITAVAAP